MVLRDCRCFTDAYKVLRSLNAHVNSFSSPAGVETTPVWLNPPAFCGPASLSQDRKTDSETSSINTP